MLDAPHPRILPVPGSEGWRKRPGGRDALGPARGLAAAVLVSLSLWGAIVLVAALLTR